MPKLLLVTKRLGDSGNDGAFSVASDDGHLCGSHQSLLLPDKPVPIRRIHGAAHESHGGQRCLR